MIAFLPELYPDELLSSFCARYHELMGYRSRECTGRDLFGKERAKVAFDLPSNLGALVKRVPFTNWKTLDQLIDQHTLLPFYAPFVSPHKLSRIRTDMTIDEGGTIHARLGVLTHAIRVENFRYCSECVQADRLMFGETYWHRLHQLSGTDVCPTHRTFLNHSSLHTRHRGNREAFVTAERAITTVTSKQIDARNEDHMAYVKLAEDARWLLETVLPSETNEGNRKRYLGLLYLRGLSGYHGPVKLKVLIEALRQHYSADLLEHFHCALQNKHNWVTRLIHEMGRSQNPIEHLLLIRFLGLSAADFFRTPARRRPFGEGPWPCLNPTCKEFRQLTINHYEKGQTKSAGDPIGTFNCKCGFSYYRIGPDKTLEDRYYATGFICITRAWIANLRQACCERSLISHLAIRFCTNPETVRLMLEQTQVVPLSRKKKMFTVAGEHNPPTAKFLRTRKLRRDRWLRLLASNEGVPRSKFCKANTAEYSWLVLYDKKWLYRHLPPRRTGHGPGFRTDWNEQDKIISQQVRKEAERIRSMPGELTRASKTLITKNLGKLHFVIKRGHLVPLTLQALSEASETIEEFAIRRIRRKAESLREQGISVPAWKLQSRARVGEEIANRPVVREALESFAKALTS
jgi:hypothetical protein